MKLYALSHNGGIKIKSRDVLCKNCGQPLKESRVVVACTDQLLGSRIIIECSKCGYLNRFRVKGNSE